MKRKMMRLMSFEFVEAEYKQTMDDMSTTSNVNNFEPLVYEQTMDDMTLAINVNEFEPLVYEQTMDNMTTVSDVNANFNNGLWTKPTYPSSSMYPDSDYENDEELMSQCGPDEENKFPQFNSDL